MHPDPDGNGVIIIYEEHSYKLVMQNGEYFYEKLNYQPQHPRDEFVSMMVPDQLVENLA